MCGAHYAKFIAHGDPNRGRTYLRRGSRAAFVEEAISFCGVGCLLWPFSHNGNGYGIFSQGSKKFYAHRVVCERANGPAPDGKTFVAHHCGNGRLGCVNPTHLRWASCQENSDDTILHGRSLAGERHWNAALSASDVLAIDAMRGAESALSVANKFGVSKRTVFDVWERRTWQSVLGTRA